MTRKTEQSKESMSSLTTSGFVVDVRSDKVHDGIWRDVGDHRRLARKAFGHLRPLRGVSIHKYAAPPVVGVQYPEDRVVVPHPGAQVNSEEGPRLFGKRAPQGLGDRDEVLARRYCSEEQEPHKPITGRLQA